MNDYNLSVLTNVIGAVESGGQVYGKRRYNAYSPRYTNSAKEYTITIGWAQCYGHEARQLMKAIYEADPAGFERLDKCKPSIASMLTKDWVSMKWDPSASQKAVIISIIDSATGHKVQDTLFAEKMKKLIADCAADYTDDTRAQMMYCEIRHLGGRGPCDRIFKRCAGDYSLDRIMTALVQDQRDLTSDNQVGDTKYWSRHVKCRSFIEQYAKEETDETPKETPKEEAKGMTEEQAIDRVIEIAEAEIGYHEKASGDLKYLYTKDKNNGSANYTKYNYEMHKLQPRNMDYPGAWCNCWVCWVFKEAFSPDTARKVLCGDFDDYTPNSSNLYKKAGRWYSTPKRGDQAYFKNSQRICHTGIVYRFDGKRVYTIEGNAGNVVCKKSYLLGDSYIAGFGRPLYSKAANVDPAPVVTDNVKQFQMFLNNNYTNVLNQAGVGQLLVDGEYGPKTRAAAVAVFKYMANKYYNASLSIKSSLFLGGCQKVSEKMTDAEVVKHPTLDYLLQGILAGRGFYGGPLDAVISTQTKEAIKKLQKEYKLAITGTLTGATWYSLYN